MGNDHKKQSALSNQLDFHEISQIQEERGPNHEEMEAYVNKLVAEKFQTYDELFANLPKSNSSNKS